MKTMHRAISRSEREPDVAGFTLHGDQPAEPVLGRLVARVLCHAFCQVQTARYAAQTSRILRTFVGVEIGDRRNRASYGGFCAPNLQWRFSNLRNWQGGAETVCFPLSRVCI
jgi:hypothetical protein